MRCVNCNTETTNPRFCGRSCSTAYNNRRFPKRKRQTQACPNCQTQFFKRLNSNQTFCSVECRKTNYCTRIKAAGRFDINGQPSSATVRKFLIATQGNNCAVCAQSGNNWRGQPLTLIVDHIDGNAYNWKLANIRLVCPNCDSQLPTFKGRNKGKSTRKYTIIQR